MKIIKGIRWNDDCRIFICGKTQRDTPHCVCRKTVYIRVKLHNYTLYAEIHTYFFVRSVKNAEKMSAVLLKMTHLNGKILDFEKGRKNSRCFYAENDCVVKQLRGRSTEK